jgi:formylglycine-generating enzyme required for sulfatase activity
MTRQNYGSLRGGGTRRSGGAWQWTVIGFVFGFGCAAIVGLVLVITGASDSFSSIFAANRPTQTAFVITNTPLPVTDTPQPTEQLALTSTPTSQQVQLNAPTATSTPDPNLVQVVSSATPTTPAAPTAASAQQGPRIPAALVGKVTTLMAVQGGTFDMGTRPDEVAAAARACTDLYESTCDVNDGVDSSPVHKVNVSPFFIEEKEVTYEQYMAFLNSEDSGMGARNAKHRNGCQGQLCIETRTENENSPVISDSQNYRVNPAINTFPVTGVTWYGAQAYCQAIGRRLPTEAEWERAARGPNNTIFPWGDAFDVTLARTSRPRETDPALLGPKPVGSYLSYNGLFDMTGNVAEWVSDWYDPNYYTAQAQSASPIVDPPGPPAGTDKVLRGGNWDAVPFYARSVHRQNRQPLSPTLWAGFRCASNTNDNPGAPQLGNTTGSTPGSLALPTVAPVAGGSEEDTANAAPTLAPPPIQPTSSGPLPTLAPGG